MNLRKDHYRIVKGGERHCFYPVWVKQLATPDAFRRWPRLDAGTAIPEHAGDCLNFEGRPVPNLLRPVDAGCNLGRLAWPRPRVETA